MWVTKRVTQLNRKINVFRIKSLEGEFESSPGHHKNFILFFNGLGARFESLLSWFFADVRRRLAHLDTPEDAVS